MSYYGITKVKWDAAHNYIDQVLLHDVIQRPPGSSNLELGPGTETRHYDVSSLIAKGNKVYVYERDGAGGFMRTDKIHVKQGIQDEYLESADAMGNLTTSLEKLDTW